MVDLGAVLHQETLHTGELVGLGWKDDNIKLNIGKVLPRKFQGTQVVGIFGVDDSRRVCPERAPATPGWIRCPLRSYEGRRNRWPSFSITPFRLG